VRKRRTGNGLLRQPVRARFSYVFLYFSTSEVDYYIKEIHNVRFSRDGFRGVSAVSAQFIMSALRLTAAPTFPAPAI